MKSLELVTWTDACDTKTRHKRGSRRMRGQGKKFSLGLLPQSFLAWRLWLFRYYGGASGALFGFRGRHQDVLVDDVRTLILGCICRRATMNLCVWCGRVVREQANEANFHVRGGSLFLAQTNMDKGTPHRLQYATRCLVPCKTNAFSASTIFTFYSRYTLYFIIFFVHYLFKYFFFFIKLVFIVKKSRC